MGTEGCKSNMLPGFAHTAGPWVTGGEAKGFAGLKGPLCWSLGAAAPWNHLESFKRHTCH